ncbi:MULTISPECIES: hypothetical protein [Bacillales]|uniref:hypothetical protein n=1 Tax=Brevibacillus TaxID=55080 RepID=UPI001491F9A9|nr:MULTISPECIES: hypothetical protein [Bacillales]MBR8660389.1 hypothetical protein [Brevibacillus sp. NL20B1]NNV03365.1 hypothetical protein [Brevibacillus sp. MCWH]UFJ61859.1 hypothetical protein IRT44_03145 [Anoxybacillus sediminis]
MKKIIGLFLFASVVMASLTPTAFAYTKPSGNYCGADDKTPGSSSTKIQYFKIPYEVEYSGDTSSITPLLLDKWVYSGESKACGLPFTVESYTNNYSQTVNYTFTAKASKSTTYNTSVNANFLDAFNATMGYQATNTVERSSQFSVPVKPYTTVTLKASPSLAIIKGTWKYLTGSKYVEVYYPTHLRWITE